MIEEIIYAGYYKNVKIEETLDLGDEEDGIY